jgi:transcription elongation GreA/GreB family factor
VSPLAQTNLSKATSLQTEAGDLLSQAKDKGLDTGSCEKLISEASELLNKAKIVSTNPIYANNLALQAIQKLQQAIDCLKAILG